MKRRSARPPRLHPWAIRLAHWLHAGLLVVMAGSGLQILVAYPSLGPRGATVGWYPWNGSPPPAWLRIGQWLAGARHVHFAFAWYFVANGLFYLVYLFASGEWRRRPFLPRRDMRNALLMFAHYLRLRRTAPEQGLYNGLQRLSYSGVLALGVVSVLTGLAMYKPLQLRWVAALFGGYEGARDIHLVVLGLFGAFVIVHVILVAAHPRELWRFLTGGRHVG